MQTYDEYWIKWCEDRSRLYKAWGEALRIVGPILARQQDEQYLRLFTQEK
jgi:hypothetical protein